MAHLADNTLAAYEAILKPAGTTESYDAHWDAVEVLSETFAQELSTAYGTGDADKDAELYDRAWEVEPCSYHSVEQAYQELAQAERNI